MTRLFRSWLAGSLTWFEKDTSASLGRQAIAERGSVVCSAQAPSPTDSSPWLRCPGEAAGCLTRSPAAQSSRRGPA